MLGKRLLPWFGGTSAVWTTCLLFFQAALLAGYAWAHLLADRLSPRRQRDAHLALLGAALALPRLAGLRLAVADHARATSASRGRPTRRSRRSSPCSASTIGLPFVALAATSPLLQAWFARLRPGPSPFWLFALSNARLARSGSSRYPLLVEPCASVRTQGWLWSAAFAAYAAGVAWCAARSEERRSPGDEAPAGTRRRIRSRRRRGRTSLGATVPPSSGSRSRSSRR